MSFPVRLNTFCNTVCGAALIASALALTPLAASAATFTVSLPGNYFGSNGSAGATISDSTIPLTEGVAAGGFAASGNLHGMGVANFTAWCLDIVTSMKTSSDYITTTTPFQSLLSPSRMTNILRLFDTGFKTLNLANGADSGGFQLALWELMYENAPTFDLTSGNFTASSAGALAKAQSLLAGLTGPVTQSYALTWLQSDDPRGQGNHYSQNLVTASPVPLPAGGLLLVTALAGLAALRRRPARLLART